jgi:hypothetical protein
MAEYEGEIKSFQPSGNKIVVGSLKLHLNPYLFVNVAKNFKIGDMVLVEYLDGEVKSVVRKGVDQ